MLNKFTLSILLAVIVCTIEPLYAWGETLGEGNILISSRDFLYEYTETGILVQTYSIPYPSSTRFTESARDIVSVSPGDVFIYNGTFDPYVTTLDVTTDIWTNQTHPGWSTINNGTYGGIAALENYVFVTDMSTYGEGDEASGIIRFDRISGLSERFADNIEPIDLTLGLDGLLYALYPGGSPGGRFIDVYNPETLSFIRTISLAAIFGHTAHRAVAVNKGGDLFVADWDGDLQVMYYWLRTCAVLLQRAVCMT